MERQTQSERFKRLKEQLRYTLVESVSLLEVNPCRLVVSTDRQCYLETFHSALRSHIPEIWRHVVDLERVVSIGTDVTETVCRWDREQRTHHHVDDERCVEVTIVVDDATVRVNAI